jgi:hypothetical protein
MSATPHPSTFLPADLLSDIRGNAHAAEATKSLHGQQVRIIYEQRWFRMLTPAGDGAPLKTLREVLEIEEALAWADGSTAWVVTLCSGAGWFYGFLHRGLAKKIFNDPEVCLAGSGAATGTAEKMKRGFRINGTWKYASGALHATMFTANCIITENEKPLTNIDGTPVIRSFIFDRGDVILEKNWNSVGMIATASHGFTIRDLQVEDENAFQIDPEHTTHDGTIYRYPFLQLAETTLAVNYSGMTQQFLDLCLPLFERKMNGNYKPSRDLVTLQCEAVALLQQHRDRFYKAVAVSWAACETNDASKDKKYETVSKVSHELYRTCLSLIDSLYPYTGLTGADTTSELNRVWRNFHTASQHSLFSMKY